MRADTLVVGRAELKGLTLSAHVPDQVGQKVDRAIVPQAGDIGQRAGGTDVAPGKFHTLGAEDVTVHPKLRGAGQPDFKILEDLGEPFENPIGRCRQRDAARVPGEPALHAQARAAPGAPFDRAREYPVDLAWRRLGPDPVLALVRQECLIKLFGLRPYLAGDKAVRAAQELQVIVEKDVRLALKVELGQRQRAAFDALRIKSHQSLEVAFVRDPHAPKIGFKARTARIVQQRFKGRTAQAPPLASHMGVDSGRNAPAHANASLEVNKPVKKASLPPPRERKIQRKAFHVEPADNPGHIARTHAFDEIRPGPLG